MTTTTVGAFNTRNAAEEVIVSLKDEGIAESDISCVYADKDGNVEKSSVGDTVGTDTIKGATTGAIVGALAGLVVANGLLPGLGTLFVAGPITVALGLTGVAATTVAGAATGLAAGALLGALTHIGIPEKDAEYYQNMIQKGSYLVIVRSAMQKAKKIMETHHSNDIREYTSTTQ